ncbi:unnamed protein product [Eruca vesicaria subsp. sativa]|uniref:Uncharacterized protein n=1 Tax=Eruca vesicaria subsp. sativa TaxID=29727 RepID=A0ABC8L391_ERUVS|nr:unnamed protein product [Eruca vesicaria subsp. sativa]
MISANISNMYDKIKDISLSLRNSQEEFQKKMEDLFRSSLKEITDSITNACTRPHVQQPDQAEQDNSGKESRSGAQTSSCAAADIIEEALRFANKETSNTCEESNEENMTDDLSHGAGGCGEGHETLLNRDISEEDTVNKPIFHTCLILLIIMPVEPAVLPTINSPERSIEPPPDAEKANQETFGNGPPFPEPSFSIGLTQLNKENAQNLDHVPHEDNDDSLQEGDVDEEGPILNRKSKRTKVVPRNLVGDYQCDIGILARAWESYINAICRTPSIDYAAKFSNLRELMDGSKVVIDIGGAILQSSDLSAIVDRSSHLTPKQAGRQLTAKEMKPLTIDRPRAISQNRNLFESDVTTVVLIHAHAFGGVDVCKCITPEVLDTEVQRIAVMMYNENVAPL